MIVEQTNNNNNYYYSYNYYYYYYSQGSFAFFSCCSSLTQITLTSGLTMIGYRMFDLMYEPTLLSSIVIPSTITTIGMSCYFSLVLWLLLHYSSLIIRFYYCCYQISTHFYPHHL